MKTLIAGWFSFEQMGATAGDLLARDLVVRWLEETGRAYEIATAAPFSGGVDWRTVDPAEYSHIIFVCGPFGNGAPLAAFLARFPGRRLIGVNLSMLQPLEEWNPFDLLLERDSSRAARPDLVFLSERGRAPVVGLVQVHPQKEYGKRGRHQAANEAIERLVASREMARVRIDTRLDSNSTGLRTEAEVEALIARMDVVVTTRLHGLVLALKNGIPALAIDPVAGGAKIRRQAEAIGWPVAFSPEMVSDEALETAFDYCITAEARTEAERCRKRAIEQLQAVKGQLISALVSAA